MQAILPFVLAYLLGSIPFGLVLTRLSGAGDLRAIGSGNIGATNVLRTGRKGLAAATLLLDAGKGAVAVLLVRWWMHGDANGEAVAALGAMVGHCFPVWLGFAGGKGVATLLGTAFALDWRIGAIAALAWIAATALTRISSVGGMSAAIVAPIAALVMPRFLHPALLDVGRVFAFVPYALALAAMAAIVIWRHRANIARLRAGTEPRIGGGKKPA